MNKKLLYVLSTHWDREWYQTFQDFRYRMVTMLDKVLDGFKDGSLTGPFESDGQVIMLEDYLEVRPEREQELRELLSQGLIAAGPWYVMSDEFLVSGESHIRNLEMGHDLIERLGGKPLKAGFVCDIFGHNSQLPQILSGFGIDSVFLWRGVNDQAERWMKWKGSDGTIAYCYRFGSCGYCAYVSIVREGAVFDKEHDEKRLLKNFQDFIADESKHTPIDTILLFDGGDHQEWDQEKFELLISEERKTHPDLDIRHGTLADLAADARKEATSITRTLNGELRETWQDRIKPLQSDIQGGPNHVIPGVLSSRVWIKQLNAQCESQLCQWAEPYSTFTRFTPGTLAASGYLETAWKWLLKNHPHDSICGCSIDAVHDDMRFRFHQASGIANRLAKESIKTIAAAIKYPEAKNQYFVTVFNPVPYDVTDIFEIEFKIPEDWPCYHDFFPYEPKQAFRLYTPDGEEIPYQVLQQQRGVIDRQNNGTKFSQGFKRNLVKVAIPMTLPAYGYTTITVTRPEDKHPTRHPRKPSIVADLQTLENQYLKVTVESNGTLTLHDKQDNQTYHGLMAYEDMADIGDGWYHGPPVNNTTSLSTVGRANVSIVHDGQMQGTIRVEQVLELPEEFDFQTMTRSKDSQELRIVSHVTLKRNARQLEIKTSIDNTIKDHRLRVLFPTDTAATCYYTDTPFDVIERPIALPENNHTFGELEVETKPQQSWVGVGDGKRGLSVISHGLYESCVQDLASRPIALTLFRSTRKTVFTDGEPGGQLLGPLSFKYIVAPSPAPHATTAELFRVAQRLSGGIRTIEIGRDQRPFDVAGPACHLDQSHSFMRVKGNAVLTSLRERHGEVTVRLFNPGKSTATVQLELNDGCGEMTGLAGVTVVDLEGNPTAAQHPASKGTVSLEISPKKIVTAQLNLS